MKTRLLLVTSITALGGFALPQAASAQAMWATTQSVTVSLTLGRTVEGLQLKDETGHVLSIANGGGPTFMNDYSVVTLNSQGDPIKTVTTHEEAGKAASSKLGNAEILTQMKNDGMLLLNTGEPATSIAGWSLVLIGDGADDGIDGTIIARHTSKAQVPVDGLMFGRSIDTPAESSTYSRKDVLTDNTPVTGEPTSSESHTFTATIRALGNVSLAGMDTPAVGIFTAGAGKITLKTEGTGIDKVVTPVFSPAAIKVDKVIGTFMGADALPALLEGSVSTGAASIVDLNTYGPPM